MTDLSNLQFPDTVMSAISYSLGVSVYSMLGTYVLALLSVIEGADSVSPTTTLEESGIDSCAVMFRHPTERSNI